MASSYSMSDYDQFETFDEPQPQYTEDDDNDKVNVWVIVGIVVAVVILIAIAIVVGVVVHKNKQPKQTGGFTKYFTLEEKGAKVPRRPTINRFQPISSDSVYDSSLNNNNAQLNDANLPYKTEQYNIL